MSHIRVVQKLAQLTEPEPQRELGLTVEEQNAIIANHKADEYIRDMIQAECKYLSSESNCRLNKRCFWKTGAYISQSKCKRDAKTVTAEEQEEISKIIIGKMPRVVLPPHPPLTPPTETGRSLQMQKLGLLPQIQKSHHSLLANEAVLEVLSPNDSKLERLADTHFLKQRKKEILSPKERADRIYRREKSYSTYRVGRRDLVPGPDSDFWSDETDKADIEEAIFVRRINELPIFLYAHEVPVQVVSPERYKDQIGTISFIPDTKTPLTLHLQENETGKELSFLLEKGTTYRAPPGWSQPTKSADYVTYTADEKEKHPALGTHQYWQKLDNGLYTILASAGGGGSRRSNRKMQKTRYAKKCAKSSKKC